MTDFISKGLAGSLLASNGMASSIIAPSEGGGGAEYQWILHTSSPRGTKKGIWTTSDVWESTAIWWAST